MGRIGEAGVYTNTFSPENVEREILFEKDLDNPVISLTGTSNGGDPYTFRITEIRDDGFKFIVEEWEYLDGPHGASETIHWLAIEAGEHELADGRKIKAGFATGSTTSDTGVNFTNAFDGPDVVVLTTVSSGVEQIAVDSDPRSVSNSGFTLSLQEEENERTTAVTQNVGWIAVETGGDGSAGTSQVIGGFDESVESYSLGADYTAPVVQGATQTINGGDTATVNLATVGGVSVDAGADTANLFLREEQSRDTETGHIDEELGLVVFETGKIVCFEASTQILTPEGEVEIGALEIGDDVVTRDGWARPVRWIGRRTLRRADLEADLRLRPIVIRRGAFGHGMPQRDLRVSRQHRFLVQSRIVGRVTEAERALIPAVRLLPMPGVEIDHAAQHVTYVHIALDAHDLIIANGMVAETLLFQDQTILTITPREMEDLRHRLGNTVNAPPCAPIPEVKVQREIVRRHIKNSKPLLPSAPFAPPVTTRPARGRGRRRA